MKKEQFSTTKRTIDQITWRKHLGVAEKYQEIQRHGNAAENFSQVIIKLNFFSTNYRDEFQMFSNKAVVSYLFMGGRLCTLNLQ